MQIKTPTPHLNINTKGISRYSRESYKKFIPTEILKEYTFFDAGSSGGCIAAQLHKKGHKVAILTIRNRSRGILIDSTDHIALNKIKQKCLKT